MSQTGLLSPFLQMRDDRRLNRAIRHGDIVLLEKALKAGADPNRAISGVTTMSATEDGLSALALAVLLEKDELVPLLLQYGADPHQNSNLWLGSPLVELAKARRLDTLGVVLAMTDRRDIAPDDLAPADHGRNFMILQQLVRNTAERQGLNGVNAPGKEPNSPLRL
jgi:hypothetical protein